MARTKGTARRSTSAYWSDRRVSRKFLHPVRFTSKPSTSVSPFTNSFPPEIYLFIANEVASCSAVDLLHLSLACTMFSHFCQPLLRSYRLTVGIPKDLLSLKATEDKLEEAVNRVNGVRLDNIRILTVFWDCPTGSDLNCDQLTHPGAMPTTAAEIDVIERMCRHARDRVSKAMLGMTNLKIVRLWCWNTSWNTVIAITEHVTHLLEQAALLPAVKEITVHHTNNNQFYGNSNAKRFPILSNLFDQSHFDAFYPYAFVPSTGLTRICIMEGLSANSIEVVQIWRKLLEQNHATIRDIELDISLFSKKLFKDWILQPCADPKMIRLERLHLCESSMAWGETITEEIEQILNSYFRHTDEWTDEELDQGPPIGFDIRGLRVLKLPVRRERNHSLDDVFAGHMPHLQHFSTCILPRQQKDIAYQPMMLEELEVLDDSRGQTRPSGLRYITRHWNTLKRLTTYEHWLQSEMAEVLAKKLVFLEKLTTACDDNVLIQILQSFRYHTHLRELVVDDWERSDASGRHFARIMDFLNSGGGPWALFKRTPRKLAHITETHGKMFNYTTYQVEDAKTSVPLKTTGFALEGMPPNLEIIRVVVRKYVTGKETQSPIAWTYKRVKKTEAVGSKKKKKGIDEYVWVKEEKTTYTDEIIHGYEVYQPPKAKSMQD